MENNIFDVYHCNHCGLTVEVTSPGAAPVCCGEKMVLCKENTSDGAKEKHIPVLESANGGSLVRVGSIAHPMTEEHYIQWISLQTKQGNQRKVLKPTDAPEACFCLCEGDEVEAVYEYCNLHGLWKA